MATTEIVLNMAGKVAALNAQGFAEANGVLARLLDKGVTFRSLPDREGSGRFVRVDGTESDVECWSWVISCARSTPEHLIHQAKEHAIWISLLLTQQAQDEQQS